MYGSALDALDAWYSQPGSDEKLPRVMRMPLCRVG
jgi:hypothetical protein